ncbi:MAG: outer membrane protein transport protein [Verrucomicrobia bacterium]|nr:outer membrane protein transport protein [Verrucomicrobiota bacterium]
MKTNSYTQIALIVGLLGLPYSFQAAESLSLIPDSAEALGIAGGRFANLRDATTARVAPASMIDIEQATIQFNTGLWRSDIGLESAAGVSLHNNDPWVYPASFYAVIPLASKNVAFGLGLTTPYGLGSQYSKSSALRYAVPYESSLRTYSITPSVAFRLSDTISAGLGLDFMYGNLQINQLFPIAPGFDGELRFNAQGWGTSGFGSILWNLTPRQRLSLVGRLPLRLEMAGDLQVRALGTTVTDFSTNMTFPGSVALGYGIDLTDRLTLGFDFKWTANNSHDDIPLDVKNVALPQTTLPLNWKNSIDLGMGATYKLSPVWLMRAGYLFSENSMPDSTYTPSIPAYDRHIFSLGLGWRGKSNRVDATYAFIYNPDRTVTGASNPAFNGSYRHQWHVLSLSFTHFF